MAKGIKNVNASEMILMSAKGQLGVLPKISKVGDNNTELSVKESIPNEDVVHYGTYDMFEPYPDVKLRLDLREGESRESLKESILSKGIHTPIAVKTGENGKFVILSGHNRVDIIHDLYVNKLIEEEKIPYLIKDNLNEDEEREFVIDSNSLRNPDEIKPSNYAYALQVKREIDMRRGRNANKSVTQGLQTDDKNTVTQGLRNSVSWVDGNVYNIGKMQATRYIKLNCLIPELMDIVDKRKISVKIAYHIAFLTEKSQKLLLEYLTTNKLKITEAQAIELKKIEQEKQTVTEDDLNSLFNVRKIPTSQKLFTSLIRKSIPDFIFEDDNAEQIIIDALKLYAEQHS